ncbi:glyoxalase [Microbacterium sp. zg.B48]|uniref:glyoxalase n=1 Tax=Microbacterium sp. zg.B48 TaxID=2969408 RepID=UPI00214C95CE|nr:glyoxalase [Microbacterium sp. zg.B48]MCR2763348.1 glyoxalase [Microbacterium sp. zg.B48]
MTVPDSGRQQRSVWPTIVSDHAYAIRDWMTALGFIEDLLILGKDPDKIHHCQLDWPEGGRVLLSSTGERPTPCRPGTSSLHVVTATPDAVMARARIIGANVVNELVNQTDYPSREFTISDPDGNHWTFATFAG